MPNNGAYPICKEGVRGSVIPGCGPLPTSHDLSWETDSGRPAQGNSTVYEVYYPKCRLPGKLNRKLRSVRCGENLTWDMDPSGIACRYGCGPLPTSHDLSWETDSGRPAQGNSTVYKVYYPKCRLPGKLNRKLRSVRCGEDLTWDVDPSGIACRYGCGKFPNGSEWRLLNGSEAGKESLMGTSYVLLCLPWCRTKMQKMQIHCGFDLEWNWHPSLNTCECDDAENQIWIYVYILGSLVMIAAICVFMHYILIRKKCVGNKVVGESLKTPNKSETSQLIGLPIIQVIPPDPGSSSADTCITNLTERIPEEQDEQEDLFYTLNPFRDKPTKTCSENIRVFQALRTCGNEKGISEFIVQKGEAVYIATNVIVKSPNYLRIWRENNTAYRGQDVYPFLHCIQCVESVDSGLYFWTTTENCLEENVFLLKVTDRGQPDGHEISIPLLSKQKSCEEQIHFLEYHSFPSNPCLAAPSLASLNNVTNDEPVCTLTVDTIFRDNSLELFRKRLCDCLDSPTSCQARACWRAIAKTFLCRTDSFISSLEWYKGDNDDGPTNLILNDLREQHKNLTIGHLTTSLPRNSDLLNNVLKFHKNCAFCSRLSDKLQQTEPKDVCSGKN
ncbi:uncharacterized protein LOC125678273 isoform X2 [Ostrea edulis]|nr:uncharacterized protein LOC125678273 isoform X2 [Ostrea edulis]XP_056011354.1 uncharacterized protein LOC125678273 isoform X2 [Ostrea edulis]